jgi:organic radical activating enzyme
MNTTEIIKIYKIQEIFESIQGEGKYSGYLATFIRFHGCNLSCSFCDTPQGKNDYKELSLWSLRQVIKKADQLYVLTGGEPLLQVDTELLENLYTNCRKIVIETNGTIKSKFNLERFQNCLWITCSPKNKEIDSSLIPFIDEYKILVDKDTKKEEIESYINTLKMVSLQPIIDHVWDSENLERAVELVSTNYRNGNAHLSLQIHKIIGVK